MVITNERKLRKMLNELSKEVHQNAVEHGWYEKQPSFGEVIAMCHSELSEAIAEYREGRLEKWYSCEKAMNCKKSIQLCAACPSCKPEGVSVELADCILRILDYVGGANIDIDKALEEKMAYNRERPYRHGNKAL